MTGAVWERLRPRLSGGEGKQGRPARGNRQFIDAVCRILRTGAPWRDLPPDYGDWKNTHRRFCRSLAVEWGRNNIRVNALGTGWIDATGQPLEQLEELLVSYTPLRRKGVLKT